MTSDLDKLVDELAEWSGSDRDRLMDVVLQALDDAIENNVTLEKGSDHSA